MTAVDLGRLDLAEAWIENDGTARRR